MGVRPVAESIRLVERGEHSCTEAPRQPAPRKVAHIRERAAAVYAALAWPDGKLLDRGVRSRNGRAWAASQAGRVRRNRPFTAPFTRADSTPRIAERRTAVIGLRPGSPPAVLAQGRGSLRRGEGARPCSRSLRAFLSDLPQRL